jgi:phage I-like protein
MRSDRDPSLEPVPDDPAGVPCYATAEDVAYAEQLAAADRAEDAALRAEYAAAGFDVPVGDAAWDAALAELVSDDAAIGGLAGRVHEADLMLLASVDPRSLGSQHARLDYVQACDRVAAFTASLRHAAVVALVGERSSGAYLPELHAEHELSLAERTSR